MMSIKTGHMVHTGGKKIMSLASNSYQDIGPRRHNPRRIPVPSVKLTQIIFYRVCVDG